jgi:hypothetical protein
MFHVHMGTDTYGKVKKVGPTAVVTRFAMVSGMPLVPLVSYYYAGTGEEQGIPILFTMRKIHGLPLSRLNILSVVIAYARAVCGALLVVGSIILLMRIVGGPPRDEFTAIAMLVGVICTCVAVVGGLLTYLAPFQTTRRERKIRQACGKVLGIWADPARVQADHARGIIAALAPENQTNKKLTLEQQLTLVRTEIALAQEPEALEQRTDELLEQIRSADIE